MFLLILRPRWSPGCGYDGLAAASGKWLILRSETAIDVVPEEHNTQKPRRSVVSPLRCRFEKCYSTLPNIGGGLLG